MKMIKKKHRHKLSCYASLADESRRRRRRNYEEVENAKVMMELCIRLRGHKDEKCGAAKRMELKKSLN